jgi:putative redox protein
MVEGKSTETPYRIVLSTGTHSVVADATREKGGGDGGFRPHDLLEAALAGCIAMAVRMAADGRRIALSGVTARVRLDRTTPDETVFEYEVELEGDLTEQEKATLLRYAGNCPVRQTLSKKISFRTMDRG